MALLDINMEGVTAQTERRELKEGQYVARIINTQKRLSKDKYLEDGSPAPGNGKNYLLEFNFKIYGGEFNGHIENEYLNLWNINEQAVEMAKSKLRSIFDATGIVATDSEAFHDKWLLIEVRPGKTAATKHKLYKSYAACPTSLIPTEVEPLPQKPAASEQSVTTTTPAPSDVPAWAR